MPQKKLLQAPASLRVSGAGQLAAAAERVGAGNGEMEAAVSNLDVLPEVVVPLVFSELYSRFGARHPGLVCLICAALQLGNAELVAPMLWPQA